MQEGELSVRTEPCPEESPEPSEATLELLTRQDSDNPNIKSLESLPGVPRELSQPSSHDMDRQSSFGGDGEALENSSVERFLLSQEEPEHNAGSGHIHPPQPTSFEDARVALDAASSTPEGNASNPVSNVSSHSVLRQHKEVPLRTPESHQLSAASSNTGEALVVCLNFEDPFPAVQQQDENNETESSVENSSQRIIPMGPARGDKGVWQTYPDNYVATRKYELWNILPKNLLEQFQRAANFWFLTVSAFQMMPGELSPTNKYATLFPLVCVLTITFCKDAYEDYGRRVDDHRVNAQKCRVLNMSRDSTAMHEEVIWKDLKVGAYVLVKRDEPIPADLVLLSCSGANGVAYVDTAQLDGETSLKPKFVLESTRRVRTGHELKGLDGEMHTEQPNELVQSFSGTVFLRGKTRGTPIDSKNFLLRGSTLRNTEWVYGLCVFAGFDTKLMRNLRKTEAKRSNVEVTANRLLLIVFGILIFAAVTAAMTRAISLGDGSTGQQNAKWTWPDEDPLQDSWYLSFFTFLIGFNNLIPISLYVTIDLVKACQGLLMERDPAMYHEATDTFCRVKNSGLNENLGQVEFVLTDKTGTLTENEMRFKACAIDGKTYGCWQDKEGPVEKVVSIPPRYICNPLVPGFYKSRRKCTQRKTMSMEEDEQIEQFFLCMSLCHTAIAEEVSESLGLKTCIFRSKKDKPPERSDKPTSSITSVSAADTVKDLSMKKSQSFRDFLMQAPPQEHSQSAEYSGPQGWSSLNNLVLSSTMGATGGGNFSAASASGSSHTHIVSGHAPLSGHVAAQPGTSTPSSHSCQDDSLDSHATPMQPPEELLRSAARTAFRSISPDEEALLSAARDFGFYFRRSVGFKQTVNIRGQDVEFQQLLCNEFSSDRKRMSVLVRNNPCGKPSSSKDAPEVNESSQSFSTIQEGGSCNGSGHAGSNTSSGETGDRSGHDDSSLGSLHYNLHANDADHIVLYVKGADNVMFERLRAPRSEEERRQVELAKQHLNEFSSHGLRTLVLARRCLTRDQAKHFIQRCSEAKAAWTNRQKLTEAVAEDLEMDLELLGITAVEDRIQAGVPETIDLMLHAGMKVWMLTGDSMDTAINIALACKLMDPKMRQFRIDNHPNVEKYSKFAFEKALERTMRRCYQKVAYELKNEARPGEFKYTLIVHGLVLYTILDEKQVRLRQLFLALACSSASVIACRLAPAQKAALVKLLRSSIAGSPLTLAIGDGGNDVSMIQEAHVGVGILGLEGRQAANAADFSIGQFRFLQSLLLVHGRWNLRRIGIVIGYCFYKNFLLVLPMALFVPFAGFSGTALYDSYLYMSYNVFFTFLPIMFVGVLDYDVTAETARLAPSLYKIGTAHMYFNKWTLIGWVFRGSVHACVTAFLMVQIFDCWSEADLLVMGSWGFWACVCVANVTLLLYMHAWMDFVVAICLGSAFLFMPWIGVYGVGPVAAMFNPSVTGVANILLFSPQLWLGLVLVIATCTLSNLGMTFAHKVFRPNAVDILREVEAGHLVETHHHAKKHNTPIVCAWAAQETDLERSTGSAAKDKKEKGDVQAIIKDELARLPPTTRAKEHRILPQGQVSVIPIRQFVNNLVASGGCVADVSRKDADPGNISNLSLVPNPYEEAKTKNGGQGVVDPFTIVTESYAHRFLKCLWHMLHQFFALQWAELNIDGISTNVKYESIEVNKRPPVAKGDKWLRRLMQPADKCSHHQSRILVPQLLEDGPVDEAQALLLRSTCQTKSFLCDGDGDDNGKAPRDNLYSKLCLTFRSRAKEQEFCTYFYKTSSVVLHKTFLLGGGIFAAHHLFSLAAYPETRTIMSVLVFLMTLPLIGFLSVVIRTPFFEMRPESCCMWVMILAVFAKISYDYLQSVSCYLANCYLPVVIVFAARMRFTASIITLLVYIATLAVRYEVLDKFYPLGTSTDRTHWEYSENSVAYFLQIGFVSLVNLAYVYEMEKLMRREFYVLDRLRKARTLTMEIFSNMFPEQVVQHIVGHRGKITTVNQDGSVLMRSRPVELNRGIISVLFCEIVGLELLSEALGPCNMFRLLDDIWTSFDGICLKCSLTKVETVGATYMAAAMPEDPRESFTAQRQQVDAAACVKAGVNMMQQAAERMACLMVGEHKDNISVRVGINSGRVFCGVVGANKPQFALFGDTVRVASQMLKAGWKTCLHVSDSTHERLQGNTMFQWRQKKMEVHGKGLMTIHQLQLSSIAGGSQAKVAEARKVAAGKPSLPVAKPREFGGDDDDEKEDWTTSILLTPVAGDGCLGRDQGMLLRGPLGSIPALATSSTSHGGAHPPHHRKASKAGVSENGAEAAAQEAAPQSGQRFGVLASLRKKYRNLEKLNLQALVGSCSMKATWNCFALNWVCYVPHTLMTTIVYDAATGTYDVAWLVLMLMSAYIFVAFGVLQCLHQFGEKRKWDLAGVDPAAHAIVVDVVSYTVFAGCLVNSISLSLLPNFTDWYWMCIQGTFAPLVLMHITGLHLGHLTPAFLCGSLMIMHVIFTGFKGGWDLALQLTSLLIVISLCQLVNIYFDQRYERLDQHQIFKEHVKMLRLMDNLMPREVLADLRTGRTPGAQVYEDMMFLLVDIVGFKKFYANRSAEQALQLVSSLFAQFDVLAVRNGVYKVCSVGDAYMLINEPRSTTGVDKAKERLKMLKMAGDMLASMTELSQQVDYSSLGLRIGLHHGSCVGGVLGISRLRFEVLGQDVQIVNAVEAVGRPGHICVSQPAKEVLTQCCVTASLQFVVNQEIAVGPSVSGKTQTTMPTYLCMPAGLNNLLSNCEYCEYVR
eukprot:TRINITY_DN19845_c1_g1_i1.p1 TRINITY_DN19845_c1_g1~~TRINITY_DN19845_c1_g1_i1.p1  ORF type:complete len:2783 (+),score=533.49 TRINITY_DN19845_c1_g1_i1:208-8556(+)